MKQLAVHPIRLHVDQDTMDFIIHFFNSETSFEEPGPAYPDETFFRTTFLILFNLYRNSRDQSDCLSDRLQTQETRHSRTVLWKVCRVFTFLYAR